MKEPSERALLTDVTIVTIFRFAPASPAGSRAEAFPWDEGEQPQRCADATAGEQTEDRQCPQQGPRSIIAGGAVLAGADARLLAQLGATDCRQWSPLTGVRPTSRRLRSP